MNYTIYHFKHFICILSQSFFFCSDVGKHKHLTRNNLAPNLNANFDKTK